MAMQNLDTKSVPGFMLRQNEDFNSFYWYETGRKNWHQAKDQTLGSITSALRFSENGGRLDFASRRGFAQTIILADVDIYATVAAIEVNDGGAMRIVDGPTFSWLNDIPDFYFEEITAVVGIHNGVSLNFRCEPLCDTDMLRYKRNQKSMFIPKAYSKFTPEFDYQGGSLSRVMNRTFRTPVAESSTENESEDELPNLVERKAIVMEKPKASSAIDGEKQVPACDNKANNSRAANLLVEPQSNEEGISTVEASSVSNPIKDEDRPKFDEWEGLSNN